MASIKKKTALPDVSTTEGRKELLERGSKGDITVLPAIHQLLARSPDNYEKLGGNLARCVETSFTKSICGDDLIVREAIYAQLVVMKKELLGEDPTPLEKLLVDRIVACWLQVQDTESRYAQHHLGMSVKQGDYHQRRMESANKRYLAAIKSLALIRKLALPALQVNIARKQINVVAPIASVTASPFLTADPTPPN